MIKEVHEKVTAFFQKWVKSDHFILGQAWYMLSVGITIAVCLGTGAMSKEVWFWSNVGSLGILVVGSTLKEVWDWFGLAGKPKTKDSFIEFIKHEWWFDAGWYMLGALAPIAFIELILLTIK